MAHGKNAEKNHRNWEYWSRRPCSEWTPSKDAKTICHRLERRRFAASLAREMNQI